MPEYKERLAGSVVASVTARVSPEDGFRERKDAFDRNVAALCFRLAGRRRDVSRRPERPGRLGGNDSGR